MPAKALAVLALATVALTPAVGNDPPKEKDLSARVRELEEKVSRLEKQLADPTRLAPQPTDLVSFGEVVTNLREDRGPRYIRVRIAFRVDPGSREALSEQVAREKAQLKSWLIGYLADQEVKDVSGGENVRRVQGDIKKEMGKMLQGKRKENPLKDVLFEEYVIQ